MQYDDSTDVDEEGNIVSIGGFPLNEDMIYRVGSFQGMYTLFFLPDRTLENWHSLILPSTIARNS